MLHTQAGPELSRQAEKLDRARLGSAAVSGTGDIGLRFRSYVVNEPDGRIGTFCVYEAASGEAIREHARRVGMPGEEFYPVATTVVVRPDPTKG